jgi:hypothetical protein
MLPASGSLTGVSGAKSQHRWSIGQPHKKAMAGTICDGMGGILLIKPDFSLIKKNPAWLKNYFTTIIC